MRLHRPSLFGKILKPERYRSPEDLDTTWTRAEREAVEYEMEEQLLPNNPNALHGAITVVTSVTTVLNTWSTSSSLTL